MLIFINGLWFAGSMCGVIGVISRENRNDLGALLAHGLYQLQNRGDYSAGVATIRKLPVSRKQYRVLRQIAVEHTASDFNSMRFEKGHGKVSDVFNTEKLQKLVGFMGVGQVRYPTAGYTISASQSNLTAEEKELMRLSSIQPLFTPYGKIIMVHNGDVHNYAELDNYFTGMGIRKAGNNDAEVMLKVFSEEFFKYPEDMDLNSRVEVSVKSVMEKVKATYSCIVAINNIGLVAFRDPEGRRPLFFGVMREQDGHDGEITDYAFGSETIALDKMLFKGTSKANYSTGRPAFEEIAPGEMLFISKDFNVYRTIVKPSSLKFCPFEASYFMRASSYINNKLVKDIRKDIVELMWNRFMKTEAYSHIMRHKEITIICPVPRTAESAAIHLANKTGLSYNSAIEKHPYSPRIFMQPTQEHREVDTIADHSIFREEVNGKYVIIVDDSIVRGTTIKHDIKYLRNLGAKEVHLFVTFPAIRHPCNHAIDFHTTEELLAHGKTLDEIKIELGLSAKESLVYATPEELSKAIGLQKQSLCNECYLNGEK